MVGNGPRGRGVGGFDTLAPTFECACYPDKIQYPERSTSPSCLEVKSGRTLPYQISAAVVWLRRAILVTKSKFKLNWRKVSMGLARFFAPRR